MRSFFAKVFGRRPELIFDLGANDGRDTEFYLSLGYRVVAVEANPRLADRLETRFCRALSEGALTIVREGVWSQRQELTFYENLDNDHWSSFDPEYGKRNGTSYKEVRIKCITPSDLIDRFGVPHYMKIDIEGADRHVLRSLPKGREPRLISVEEYGVAAIDDLAVLGYREMCLVPQRVKPDGRDGRHFDGRDSGPFGDLLPYHWMSVGRFRDHFIAQVRTCDGEYVGPEHEWYDVHARL